MGKLRETLVNAGFRSEKAPVMYKGLQLIVTAIGLFIGGVFGLISDGFTQGLIIKGGLGIVGGFMGFPDFVVQTFAGPDAHSNWLHGWLIPYVSEAELTLAKSIKWAILLGSIALASTAVYIAYLKYGRDNVASSDAALKTGFGPAYQLWSDKYKLDEIYEGYIANPILRLSDNVLAVFDIKVIDGLVNLTAGVVSFSGSLLRYVQTGNVSSYAAYFVIGALLVAGILLF